MSDPTSALESLAHPSTSPARDAASALKALAPAGWMVSALDDLVCVDHRDGAEITLTAQQGQAAAYRILLGGDFDTDVAQAEGRDGYVPTAADLEALIAKSEAA